MNEQMNKQILIFNNLLLNGKLEAFIIISYNHDYFSTQTINIIVLCSLWPNVSPMVQCVSHGFMCSY